MSKQEYTFPKTMQAALVTKYGGPEVITMEEVPLPRLLPGSLLIRVRASAVNSGDARVRALDAPQPLKTLMRFILGFHKPRRPILGTVFSGTVAAIGEGVSDFQVDDRVFGATPGMSFGCHAQYMVIPQTGALTKMPEHADPGEMAALVFGGATALFFLEKAGAAFGKRVLIYGASGAVGSMAVQIAKAMGMEVTGVASGPNRDVVTSLGAHEFLDYTQQGFRLPDASFDLVFDAVGKLPKKLAIASLKSNGSYVTVGGTAVAKETADHIRRLREWYENGKIKPVISHRFDFADISKAYELVDSGRKVGSAVLVIE